MSSGVQVVMICSGKVSSRGESRRRGAGGETEDSEEERGGGRKAGGDAKVRG